MKLVTGEGYEIGNIDSVIVCEKPKIAPHVPAIKNALSQITGLSGKALGLKATTTDRMGFTGRGEGIASYAVALISKRSA